MPMLAISYIPKTNLQTVVITSGTSISDYAFEDCARLADITIPISVTSIGNYAFRDCYSFTNVYYEGSQAQWARINIGSGNSYLTYVNIVYNYVA